MASGDSCRAMVPGQRRATGPAVRSMASWSICWSSWYDEGANIVMPGTLVSSIMSSTPWCEGPSSPVMPARSRQNTTGCPCSASHPADPLAGLRAAAPLDGVLPIVADVPASPAAPRLLVSPRGQFSLADWLAAHPQTDSQQLRALVRQARKDGLPDKTAVTQGAFPRQGRAYRDIFKLVRDQLSAQKIDSP